MIPTVAIIDSNLAPLEKAYVTLLATLGLLLFEVTSEGSVFRPAVFDEGVIESLQVCVYVCMYVCKYVCIVSIE